jgi:DNA polymerase III alpha subunit
MIPLHVHSYYSLREGTISIEDLISRAKQTGLESLALTDTNGMYGLIQFAKKASEAHIKPLLGAYIDDPSDKNISALFLAKNLRGYSEICRIITTRKLKDDFSLTRLLNQDIKDVFIITGSLELLKNIPLINQNLFVELVALKAKKKELRELYNFAQEKHMHCVAANPVYFLDKEDFILHKAVSAMRTRGTIANLPVDELVNEEFYFKDPREVAALWKKLPEVLAYTDYIASQCSVDLKLGSYKFPAYTSSDGSDSFTVLWKLCSDGLEKRYKVISASILNRLHYELETINNMHFTDYFLVVWDILREAKKRGMMTIGRGSAANSLVSYCLGFTEVDPIKYNLYFERFLNTSRTSPPDIDIDFSWKERDQIIRYVFEKYGYDRVAMISTHVTMRARSAFREVAKTFGVPDGEISKMSRYIPWTDARNLPNLSKMFPESKSLNFESEPWKTIVSIAAKLANFPRHLSIHPGGIVISPTAITDYTALEYVSNKGLGLIVTQPDMHGVEDIGLIKIDLLSQRSLGVLRDTVRQIEINSDVA